MQNAIKRMLIAEDTDARFAVVDGYVGKSEFSVKRTCSGSETYTALRDGNFDVAVLDLHLKDMMSGQDVIKSIRRIKPYLPIVAMTDEAGDPAVEECLSLGANDCLVAPFSERTFMARIRKAVWHCSFMKSEFFLEWGEIRMDLKQRTAAYRGRAFALNDKEFALLQPLLKKEGGVVASDELEMAAWGNVNHMSIRLEKTLSVLRRKFEAAGAPKGVIENRRGVGYAITV